MVKKLKCAYCGKELQEEAPDSEDISYIVDPDDMNIVCLDCLHHNPKLHYPVIKIYPGGEEFWISEKYGGTDGFIAKWVSIHKYKGLWEISSDVYKKIEYEDLDSKVSELNDKGVEFAVIDNNDSIEIWVKK